MNWSDIKVSANNTHFLFNADPCFGRQFIEVLKFHTPGLAAVKDEHGSYHIDSSGNDLYKERYTRTFGFYCNRAAVMKDDNWFHITEKGTRAYLISYAWTGNFQEDYCSIRDFNNRYFHIDLNGNKIYDTTFKYVGDFKDGIACVKLENGFYRHVDNRGNFINDIEFHDLDVFHKNFATAKDGIGWFHIDKRGIGLYSQRYQHIEPFYNGFALVELGSNKKQIIDEAGRTIMDL